MSTHQQTNPRRANQSMTEESARPGTVRSNVGCEAIDEPWTNSTAGLPAGEPTYFSQRNSRMSPSGVALAVQCSMPSTGASAPALSALLAWSSVPLCVPLQSTFAPVSRTTFAHWSFSARKKRPNSAGVEPTISMPAVAM